MSTYDVSRRGFLLGTGGLAVSFSLSPAVLGSSTAAAAAAGGVRITDGTAAGSLAWLVLTPAAISLHSGKVELGTGVRTALTQIVVEELHFASANVKYVQGDTLTTPDQGTTAGSKSIQNGGPELRQAAATAFQALLDLAALPLGRAQESAEGERWGGHRHRNRTNRFVHASSGEPERRHGGR